MKALSPFALSRRVTDTAIPKLSIKNSFLIHKVLPSSGYNERIKPQGEQP